MPVAPYRCQCEECGAAFETTTYNRRFCGPRCQSRSGTRRNPRRETVVCGLCGKRYERQAGGKAKRCAACHTGTRHNRYRGGIYEAASGRWFVNTRDQKPYAFARAVMAGQMGRLLTADEIVHHVNGLNWDDRPENLQLLSRAEHAHLHAAWDSALAPEQLMSEAA